MIAQQLKIRINKALNIPIEQISIERPANMSHGDYSCNIAFRLTKTLKKNPFEIASDIASKLAPDAIIEKIEPLKPGFINFWIRKEVLLKTLSSIQKETLECPPHHFGSTKKIIIEFAHPNPFKLVHIGHLRNMTTGESICRILERAGNTVIRANYQGDVGMHIAKSIWQMRKLITDKPDAFKNKTIDEKIKLLGKLYAEGNNAYEADEKAKAEINEINKLIYQQDPSVINYWKEGRQWSLESFHQLYKRIYTHFDREYFESECAEPGLKISHEALEKGILEKSDGAIVFNGKKNGLDTRVFVNSLGLPTYEGKELGLAEKEFTDFGEIDKCLHIVASEQTSFFKVTFKVEELLKPELYKNKQYHLVYGWVRLKSGKMSSRSGNVVEANWLLDETKKKILEQFKNSDEVAETLAVAAVKYSFLKNTLQNEISFDLEESISVEGNSAPYLMYTYVRTRGILKNNTVATQVTKIMPNEEEYQLLRLLNQYPDIYHAAAANFAPHFIAIYLFELAQAFNLFYQKHQILKSEEPSRTLRLQLTKAVSTILKDGLYLLGIQTVDKM